MRTPLGLWLSLAMMLLWCDDSWGQTLPSTVVAGPLVFAGPLSMPDDPSKSAGFECNIWVSASQRPGYDSVRMLFELPVPATAERRILVRLSPQPDEMAPPRNAIIVQLPVVIEQGEKRLEIIRHVPKWTYGNSYSIQLSENGRALEAYVGELGEKLPSRRQLPAHIISEDLYRNWLVVDESTDASAIAADLAMIRQGITDPVQSPLAGARPTTRIGHWMLQDMPDDWRALQDYDCVVIDASTFMKLRESMRPQFQSLNRWLMLGGTLILRGLSDDAGLDETLGHSDQADLAGVPSLAGFAVGTVLAFRNDELSSTQQWARLVQTGTSHNSPTLRRGVDPLFGDNRYRRWLIPGVAQPPVYTFMGILTLFVILVGPVAYRMTTRRGRGYLMFAIAPTLAILTTLSMFAYGIVADGFGTVARIRQITWIDGTSGDAVTRTRGTYFAGIRPASGLRFDGGAEVLWYPDSRDQSMDDVLYQPAPPLGTVTVDDNEQRFGPSFLPSRQQRQFIVHQAITGAGSLTARRSDEGSESLSDAATLQIRSELSMDLHNVVIRDSQGVLWSIDSVPAKAVTTVQSPVPAKDRSRTLGDLYNVQRMMEEVSSGRRYQTMRQSFDLLAQLNQIFGSDDREMTDGRLENWLRNSLQLGGSLPHGSYIGLAPIESRFIAAEQAELVESVHFVFGTMPGMKYAANAASIPKAAP